MGKTICFNVSRMGHSHVKSGKPCQDSSLSWQSDDGITVAIVCDGHGGSTYVRSDVGSRLAAECALSNIQKFVRLPEFSLLEGLEGAVTAIPANIKDVISGIDKKRDLSESQKEQLDQDRRYIAAVKLIPEQEKLFRKLFTAIYQQWIDAITKYTDENPFSQEEFSALDGKKLVKAYGSTLMAFVFTPKVWFAFHIGDGKIEMCNANMEWVEPVPWDCNCFLNMTTSLCNTNPVPMFRYAFNGKGEFPTAVLMGSDGIDDSWGNTENLQNFYSETLVIFNNLGVDKAVEELAAYLPEMSRKGSQDDVSIAGIIDEDGLPGAVEVFKERRKLKALFKERNQRESELRDLKGKIDSARAEADKLEKGLEKEKSSLSDLINSFNKKKEEKEELLSKQRESHDRKISELDRLSKEYAEKEAGFNNWKEANRDVVESIKKRIADIKAYNAREIVNPDSNPVNGDSSDSILPSSPVIDI